MLVAGAALRLAGAFHDLPFSYFGDELHLTKRAMAMGGGDLNPHWFNKGALLLYVLLGLYGTLYVAGHLLGRFASPEAFGAFFLADPGPFLLIGRLLVVACGAAMIWLTARLAARALGDRAAALAAALAVAALPPLVHGSQHLKEDVPMAALALLGSWLLFRGDRPRDTAMAGAAVGLALAVKVTALAVVPAMLVVELLRARRAERPARRIVGRSALLVAAVLGAAFVASPYQFLDRSYARQLGAHADRVAGGEADALYAPDAQIVYSPTPRWWARSALAFGRMIVGWEALGPALLALVAVGLAGALRAPPTREVAAFALSAALVFASLSIVVYPFHAAPRHLAAVFPLLLLFLLPGARAVARAVSLGGRRNAGAAWAILALALAPAALLAVDDTRERLRLDSRRVARDWILQRLPREAGILLDEYGPPLVPDRRGVARLEARLSGLPRAAFTVHQDQRLRLLREHPAAHARDIEELGHQWWRPHEAPDAQLRSDPRDLAMASPLVSRVPQPLAEYRRRGLRYVVTNSEAREQYRRHPLKRAGFPSFVRFYAALDRCRIVAGFDPARWDGKGPRIWVYDLDRCSGPSVAAGRGAVPEIPSGG